jgi:hypothetical protein
MGSRKDDMNRMKRKKRAVKPYLKGNQTRIFVLSTDPLLSCDCSLVRQGIRIEILLEEFRLSRHRHRDDLTQTAVVETIKARNFASAHVTATLGHQSNTTLWIWRLEGVDVVHKRWLGRDLKVADDRVAFAAQINQVCVGIVEGEHDAVRCIQVDHDNRLVQGIRCAKRVLPLR